MEKSHRKTRTGVVVSDKMQKTITVKVTRIDRDAKYGKTIRLHNKFKVHDEKSLAKAGDTVKIEETRPLSKDKRWRLIEVLKKAQGASEIVAEPEILKEEKK